MLIGIGNLYKKADIYLEWQPFLTKKWTFLIEYKYVCRDIENVIKTLRKTYGIKSDLYICFALKNDSL